MTTKPELIPTQPNTIKSSKIYSYQNCIYKVSRCIQIACLCLHGEHTIQTFNHWCSSNYLMQQNIIFQWLNWQHYYGDEKSTRHCLVRVTCFSHWKWKCCNHWNENDIILKNVSSMTNSNEAGDKKLIKMTTFPFYFIGHDIWPLGDVAVILKV